MACVASRLGSRDCCLLGRVRVSPQGSCEMLVENLKRKALVLRYDLRESDYFIRLLSFIASYV